MNGYRLGQRILHCAPKTTKGVPPAIAAQAPPVSIFLRARTQYTHYTLHWLFITFQAKPIKHTYTRHIHAYNARTLGHYLLMATALKITSESLAHSGARHTPTRLPKTFLGSMCMCMCMCPLCAYFYSFFSPIQQQYGGGYGQPPMGYDAYGQPQQQYGMPPSP